MRQYQRFAWVADIVAIGVGTVSLTACVNPSAKIATSLEGYGRQLAQSQCVGDRLEANLSLGSSSNSDVRQEHHVKAIRRWDA